MVAMSFSFIEGLWTKVHVVSIMKCSYADMKVDKQVMYTKKQSFIHTPQISSPQWSHEKLVIVYRIGVHL